MFRIVFIIIAFVAGLSGATAQSNATKKPIKNAELFRILEKQASHYMLKRLDSLTSHNLPADAQRLQHSAWIAAYSSKYLQPYWTTHLLRKDMFFGNQTQYQGFCNDTLRRGPAADSADYAGSGYDRGQLVPAGDLRWNKDALASAFLYSNVAPQAPDLNRNTWYKLEARTREWTMRYDELVVVSGPVLNQQFASTQKGSYRVAVPRYYYKIIADLQPPDYHAIAFLVPNKKVPFTLSNYVTSIDQLETLTGIDFFPALDDSLETRIEQLADLKSWDPEYKDDVDPVAAKDFGKGKLNTVQAQEHVGEYTTVCGNVVGIKVMENGKSDPMYINLDKKFPEQSFTVVIYGETRKSFSFDPEATLMNKTICVKGKIGQYKDVPQIIVSKESQIDVLE